MPKDAHSVEHNANARLLGRRLAAYRKRSKLSQKQLEEASGVDQGSISMYENGHRLISSRNARRLATALGCHPAFLVYDDLHDPKGPRL